MRLIAAQSGRRPRHIEHILHVGKAHQVLHRTIRHTTRPFERRPFGKFQLDGEIALVLLGHETLRRDAVHQPDADEQDAEGRQHPPRMAQAAADSPLVDRIAAPQPVVDTPEQLGFAASVVGAQEVGAHHRTERQRHDGGDNDRHGDRNGELPVELPRDAGQEAHRHEDGAQHERHGDERAAERRHGLLGRLVGRQPFLFHDALDVLYDDDGIIYDDTDGENQSQKGEHIEGESENEHESECSDQGNRYGYNGNQRCTPTLQ